MLGRSTPWEVAVIRVAICAVVLCLLTWKAFSLQVKAIDLGRRTTQLKLAAGMPVDVTEPLVWSDPGVFPLIRRSGLAHKHRQNIIVVAGADSARAGEVLASFERVARATRWRRDQKLVLVSDQLTERGHQFVRNAEAVGLAVEYRLIADVRAMARQTGVTGTPAVLIYKGGRLQLMTAGALNGADEELLKAHLEDGSTSIPGNPFMVDRPLEAFAESKVSGREQGD
jgi:hypothetical protein